jgi:hypothetical protein
MSWSVSLSLTVKVLRTPGLGMRGFAFRRVDSTLEKFYGDVPISAPLYMHSIGSQWSKRPNFLWQMILAVTKAHS